jgi:hypothetical protein
MSVGMRSDDDDLLAIPQKFDLVLAPIGSKEEAHHFRERAVGAERHGTLGWLADANEDHAAPIEPVTNQLFDRHRCRLDHDVEIERRHVDRQATGVRALGECLSPILDLLG